MVAEAASPPKRSIADDPIQSALQSVAVIECGDAGHGSGFLVAPKVVATNHHVVRDSRISDIRLIFPDNPRLTGRKFVTELIYEDPLHDLAFLAVDVDAPHLIVRADYAYVKGQSVVTIGSPGAGKTGQTLENFVTDGRLGPEHEVPGGATFWSLSMPVNGGNSGGPLLDGKTGQVLGVVAATFVDTDAQSLAVSHPNLMRGLQAATTASVEKRRRAASMHRQRYCLIKIKKLLGVTGESFDRSMMAARQRDDQGIAAMDEAFNECKNACARIFEDEFADLETTIAAELESLKKDEVCEARVRIGLTKLRETIEHQAESLRTVVPRDKIGQFIDDFRSSLQRAKGLAESVSHDLESGDADGGT